MSSEKIEVSPEDRAYANALGDVRLNDLRSLVNKEISADVVLKKVHAIEDKIFDENTSNAEVIAVGISLALLGLMACEDYFDKKEASAPNAAA